MGLEEVSERQYGLPNFSEWETKERCERQQSVLGELTNFPNGRVWFILGRNMFGYTNEQIDAQDTFSTIGCGCWTWTAYETTQNNNTF